MDWTVVSGVSLGLVAVMWIADKIISLVKSKVEKDAPKEGKGGNGSTPIVQCGFPPDTAKQITEMYYTRDSLNRSIDKLNDNIVDLNKGVERLTNFQERSEERIIGKIESVFKD